MLENILEKVLPNALTLGVNYNQFWEMTPKDLIPFVKAFSLERKNEDIKAWQLGCYIKLAIVSSMEKSVKYPNSPIFSKEPEKEKPKELTDEEKMNRIKQNFLNHAMMVNNKFRQGG